MITTTNHKTNEPISKNLWFRASIPTQHNQFASLFFLSSQDTSSAELPLPIILARVQSLHLRDPLILRSLPNHNRKRRCQISPLTSRSELHPLNSLIATQPLWPLSGSKSRVLVTLSLSSSEVFSSLRAFIISPRFCTLLLTSYNSSQHLAIHIYIIQVHLQ